MVAPALGDALGPRARRRAAGASVLAGLAIAYVVFVALQRFAEKGQLNAELWARLTEPDVIRFFLNGLLNTLKAAAISLVLASILGTVLALGRLSTFLPVRTAARSYVEFFRGFPLILLIVFAFFTLPQLQIELSRFAALCAALTAYNGAVLGEIFRAGILSLDRGQTEAAEALGMRRGQAMRLVIVPQAYRRMTPTIVSQFVTLLKDTSLGFVIGYEELLRSGQIAGEFFRVSLQALIVVSVIYLVVNYALSRIARRLEVRQRRRYRAGSIVAGAPEDLVVVGLSGAPQNEREGRGREG